MKEKFQDEKILLLKQNLQTILELSQVIASNVKTFSNALSANGSL